MVKNQVFGNFLFDTDSHDGDKVEITHIVDGWSVLVTRNGGFVPQGYADDDLPESPDSDGTIFHDTDRGIPVWWDRDHYEFPVFVDNQDTLLEPQTVENTTTRTEVYNPGINPGSMVQGRVYQIDLMGKFSTTNSTSEFTVDINLAQDADVAGISSTGKNVIDAAWSIEFTMTVREGGENGVVQPHTRGLFDSEPADSHHNVVSVDTTTPTELSIDLQWNEADPDNTVTLGQAHIKQMA